jgi:hypothetical protein
VTEHDWLISTGPQVMLAFVQDSGRASERKLRLFAIACVRRVWNLLREASEEQVRDAVEAAEQLADGAITPEEFAAMTRLLGGHPIVWAAGNYDLTYAAKPEWAPIAGLEFSVLAVKHAVGEPVNAMVAAEFAAFAEATASFIDRGPDYAAAHLADHVARLGPAGAAAYATTFRQGANLYRKQVMTANGWEWETETEVEVANGYAVLAALTDARRAQADLVRDVFGSLPFRPLPSLPPSLLAWEDGVNLRIAKAVYEERSLPGGHLDGQRLAVFADALEDAGADAVLLDHLRGHGPHVRGCWAVDYILGKG